MRAVFFFMKLQFVIAPSLYILCLYSEEKIWKWKRRGESCWTFLMWFIFSPSYNTSNRAIGPTANFQDLGPTMLLFLFYHNSQQDKVLNTLKYAFLVGRRTTIWACFRRTAGWRKTTQTQCGSVTVVRFHFLPSPSAAEQLINCAPAILTPRLPFPNCIFSSAASSRRDLEELKERKETGVSNLGE